MQVFVSKKKKCNFCNINISKGFLGRNTLKLYYELLKIFL